LVSGWLGGEATKLVALLSPLGLDRVPCRIDDRFLDGLPNFLRVRDSRACVIEEAIRNVHCHPVEYLNGNRDVFATVVIVEMRLNAVAAVLSGTRQHWRVAAVVWSPQGYIFVVADRMARRDDVEIAHVYAGNVVGQADFLNR